MEIPVTNILLYTYLCTRFQLHFTLSCSVILEITLALLQRILINDVRVNLFLHDCYLSQVIWYTKYSEYKGVCVVLYMLINLPVWHINKCMCIILLHLLNDGICVF